MPLDVSEIAPGKRIRARHVRQFADLLTGVMTDQPVIFANSVTVLGGLTIAGGLGSIFVSPNGTTTALIAQGTIGQTADIFQVRNYLGEVIFDIEPDGEISHFHVGTAGWSLANHTHAGVTSGGQISHTVLLDINADGGGSAIHHTLGPSASQAAPGNHFHAGTAGGVADHGGLIGVLPNQHHGQAHAFLAADHTMPTGHAIGDVLTAVPLGTAGSILAMRPITSAFSVQFGSSTTPATVGDYADVYVPFACTVTAVALTGNTASGSAVFDVLAAPSPTFTGAAATSICGTAKPTLLAEEADMDTAVASWTAGGAISAETTLRVKLDALGTPLRQISCALRLRRSAT